MRDELLALRQQPSFREQTAPHALLDALDEFGVLVPDLRVEGDQLIDPRLLDVRAEEVVEETRRPLRAHGQDRAAGQVCLAREDVDSEVRPDEVELAMRDLAIGEERAAVLPQWPALAGGQAVRFEAVGIGGDVDLGRKARVGDRAVVALEEVLARDLPVRLDLVFGAEAKLERLDVDDRRDPLRHVSEGLGQRWRVGVRVHEDERAPAVDGDLLEAELGEVEAGLAVRARRGAQGAVEAVRPCVVRALQRFAPAGAGRDDVAAMAADVEEGSDVSLARACNNYGNLAGGGGEVGAVLRKLSRVAGVLPGVREDALAFSAQHFGVDVPRPWQRPLHAANYAWTVSRGSDPLGQTLALYAASRGTRTGSARALFTGWRMVASVRRAQAS